MNNIYTKISSFISDRQNTPAILASIITLFGALFLRVYDLGDYYYNSDEAWHLVVASQSSIWEVLKYNFYEEVHPPLSYIIWHLMLQVSNSDLWIRSASIVPGILLIPSMYIFGRLYIGRIAGYAMAMLAAFGDLFMDMSIVVRAYSMMMLAMSWMGIFVYKYNETQKRKYLIYYFALALIALLINHGAAFPVFVFGLLLMAQAFGKKSFADLAIIAAVHLTLAAMTLGYGYALQNYWQGRQLLYFNVSFSVAENFMQSAVKLLTAFSSCVFSDTYEITIIICFLLISLAFFQFIERKKWALLNIVFTPIIALFLTDYFHLFPFSQNPRNNLFLFLSFSIIIGYLLEKIYNYFATIKKYHGVSFSILLKDKSVGLIKCAYIALYNRFSDIAAFDKKIIFLVKSIIILIPLVLTLLLAAYTEPVKEQISVKKTDLQEKFAYLDKYNTEGNIFITEMGNVWYFMLIDGKKAKITYITENLALYEGEKYRFYFTAFPGIFHNLSTSLFEVKNFFADLFKELVQKGDMTAVKNIIYFSLDGVGSSFAGSFFPQFIEDKEKQILTPSSADATQYTKDEEIFKKELYDFGWAIQTSDEVTLKLAVNDYKSGDTKTLLLGMTPKFINEQILQKDFIDIITIRKKAVFGDKYKK